MIFRKNEENQYRNSERTISIAYENIEDYLQVIVFRLHNGMLPDYDDKTYTLHLQELNKLVFPKVDRKEMSENNALFNEFPTADGIEKNLLKCAKELRLVLKYWNSIQMEMIK